MFAEILLENLYEIDSFLNIRQIYQYFQPHDQTWAAPKIWVGHLSENA